MSNLPETNSALDHLAALEVAGLLPARGSWLFHRRVGGAFSRDGFVTGTLAAVDAAATLDFALPVGAFDYLRFELPAVAGCYRIGPVVIDGRVVDDLSRRVMLVHGRRLQDPDLASEIRLADWSGAPWFELDVCDLPGVNGRADLRGRGGRGAGRAA